MRVRNQAFAKDLVSCVSLPMLVIFQQKESLVRSNVKDNLHYDR